MNNIDISLLGIGIIRKLPDDGVGILTYDPYQTLYRDYQQRIFDAASGQAGYLIAKMSSSWEDKYFEEYLNAKKQNDGKQNEVENSEKFYRETSVDSSQESCVKRIWKNIRKVFTMAIG